ncbi:MAG: alkaline phosphatase family protein [Nitrospinota bacterium]
MALKILLVILDGLGDWPCAELGGLTPLQAARTPHMDALAARGSNGLLSSLGAGVVACSEEAHYALFGYPPEAFPGRGVLEALGEGIPLAPSTISMRASLAITREEGGRVLVVERKGRYREEECEPLARAIARWAGWGYEFRYHYTGQGDGLLFVEGGASPYITDTDPFRDGAPVIAPQPTAEAADPEGARRTAEALGAYLRWARGELLAHPGNGRRRAAGEGAYDFLLTKWAGRQKRVLPFSQRTGLRGGAVEPSTLYRGIARALGIEPLEHEAAADLEADIRSRLRRALRALDEGYDFVYVHSKAPDEAAHRRDPREKRETIEAVDRALSEVARRLSGPEGGDLIFVLTSDHSTPCASEMIHAGDAVPLLAVGPTVRRDAVERFDELSAAAGALGHLRGWDLMPLLLNWANRGKRAGLRPTAEQTLCSPPDVAPFRP